MKDRLSRALRDYALRILHEKGDPALEGLGWEALLGGLPATDPAADWSEDAVEPRPRWQDGVIESEIAEGATVLDLGCGDGKLLQKLMRDRRVLGQGIELEPSAVMACIERGVPVFQADLDEGLRGFPDASFDYVILEETLPTVHRPVEVLREMLRVGRRGIVSFPNFGHWKVRIELLVAGRMPVTERLSRPWHETENIHLFTFRDLESWAAEDRVAIRKGYAMEEGRLRRFGEGENLLAEEILVVLEKTNGTKDAPAPGPGARKET